MPPLTSDAALFKERRGRHAPPGRVDRTTFARGGLYLFNGAVLDSRSLAVRRYAAHRNAVLLDSVPPLALSPDERSFARLDIAAGSGDAYVLKVTDIVTRETYALPIDRARTRFTLPERLDPAWVEHYFRWERGAGGTDRLVVRQGAAPPPYRGMLSAADRSGYREYRILPGAGIAARRACGIPGGGVQGRAIADTGGCVCARGSHRWPRRPHRLQQRRSSRRRVHGPRRRFATRRDHRREVRWRVGNGGVRPAFHAVTSFVAGARLPLAFSALEPQPDRPAREGIGKRAVGVPRPFVPDVSRRHVELAPGSAQRVGETRHRA